MGKKQGSGEPAALFVLSWKSKKQFGIHRFIYNEARLKGHAPENAFRHCRVCGKNETRGENNYETNRKADAELAVIYRYGNDDGAGYSFCGRVCNR